MDNHEWAPQSTEPPRDPQGDWRTNNSWSERYDEHDSGGWTTPRTGSGHSTPPYADRQYPGHGYWDQPAGTSALTEQQAGQHRTEPERSADRTSFGRTTGFGETGFGGTAARPASGSSDAGTAAPAVDGFRAPGFSGNDRDYPAVFWWTAIWFVTPLVLYTLWASISQLRSNALHELAGNTIGVVLAAVLSVAVAAWLRRVSLGWRAITAGFAAVVVGGGIATLVISLF